MSTAERVLDVVLAVGPPALVVALLVWNRRLMRSLVLTLRRERLLAEGHEAVGAALMAGSADELELAMSRTAVAMLDELWNQERHARAWAAPPMPGEPWPDFEPAPLGEVLR